MVFSKGGKVMMILITFLMSMPVSNQGLITKVYIWGEVRQPGLYQVSSDADILELIALAGGPSPNADLSNVLLIRGEPGKKPMRINLNKYLMHKKPEDIIFLKPGDTVIIKSTLWKKIRSLISFLSSVAVFVNLYILVRKL